MYDAPMKESLRSHVYTGLRLGFGLVAGICTMALLAYGLTKLRFPDVDNSLWIFLKGYPPRLVGGICVAAAIAILASTVDRWAKMLSGFFAYAVFGGLIAVIDGGFHSEIASLQLTRIGAAALTALFAACALLTIRLGKDELHWLDRFAALSVPLLLMWAGTSDRAVTDFKVMVSLVVVLAIASAYDQILRHRHTRSAT